jgi:DNA-binding transcriptional LysR family regulator
MDIDLKLLQHAVVLSRHRHFGRAASALRISQPTLSRNIAALEKKLGMRVFERSRRDVVATPAGDDVLKMADELVARAQAISNQLQVVRDGRGGRLRVAAGSYIHDIAVQPAAIDLINANPSIRLELLEREWTAVLAMLMTDRVDFVVFDIAALKNMPALRVEPLGTLKGSYFCRAGHPLLKKKAPLQPEDLRKFPFVMSSMPHASLWLVEGIDDGLSIEPVTGDLLPSIAVSSFRVVRDLVAGTDAFGIGHLSQIDDDMKTKQFAVLDLPWRSKPPTAQMGVAYKRERTLSPAARSFIGLIRKRVRAAADR